MLAAFVLASVLAWSADPVITDTVGTPVGTSWTAQAGSGSLNWAAIASSSNGLKLAAVVNGGHIFTSTDAGVTWTERASDQNRDWYAIASSSDGVKLAAVVQTSGQIYTSTDSGVTWTARDSNRNWLGIASSADGVKLVAVAGSGTLYYSTDSGVTWTPEGALLLQNMAWTGVACSSDGSKIVATTAGDKIYTKSGAGAVIARDSNRMWQCVTSSSDGVRLAAAVSGGQIYTSTDSGVTWTARASGSRSWLSIVSNASGAKLAAGTLGGQIYTSVDSGVTWTAGGGSHSWWGLAAASDWTRLAAAGTGTTINTSLAVHQIAASMSEDGYPTAFNLTLHATDADASSITWSVSSAAAHGTASCSGTGTSKGINYIPAANYYGSDSFDIRASDPQGGNDTITVLVTVTSVNDAPAIDVAQRGTPGSTWVARQSLVASWYGIAASSDGTRLVAASYGGLLHTSTNSGASWTAQASGTADWTSVASSSDGLKLAATVRNGQIYTSTDGGSSWTARASGTREWWGIASSSDGAKLAAVDSGGLIYTSTNSGVTWTSRAVTQSWLTIASSADGVTLVAAGLSGAYNQQIYTSANSGVTWTARPGAGNADWSSVAISSDGTRMAAATYGGQVWTSTDSGVTWTAQATGNHQWSSVSMSSDGMRLCATDYQSAQVAISSDGGATWTMNAVPSILYITTWANSGTLLVGAPDLGVIQTSIGDRYVDVAISEDGSPTAFSENYSATDVEGDAVTWTISGAAGHGTAALSSPGFGTSRWFSYAPAANYYGSDTFTIQASDAGGGSDILRVRLTIASVGDTPVISGMPAVSVIEDQAYGFVPTASDGDPGTTLVFSIANKPAWAAFDTATGALTGTPTHADLGTTSGIVISVSDGGASAALPAFALTVHPIGSPAIGGIPAITVAEDSAYSFVPTASDPNGDPLTFSIANKPAWASFDAATGALTGTPVNADVGTTSGIVISVSDGVHQVALATFDLTVTNTNDAPTISGTPVTTVVEGQAYDFTPVSGDVDAGDLVVYSIENVPAWAAFDGLTGVLSGTPTAGDAGTTSGIVITITDVAGATATLPAFSITVISAEDWAASGPTVTLSRQSLYGSYAAYNVVFSAAVSGFTFDDVSLAGSTTDGSPVITVSETGSDHTSYLVSVSNPALVNGDLVVRIPAGSAHAIGGLAPPNQAAEVTVAMMAPYSGNDDFADAFTLIGSDVEALGSVLEATREASEPNHGGVAGTASIWWNWTPSASGTVTIDTETTPFDTLLGIYTGDAVNALTRIAGNDNISSVATQSRLKARVVAGTTYRIAVDFKKALATLDRTVRLHVGLVPFPVNDALADAIDLVGSDDGYGAFTGSETGSNVGGTKVANEAKHADQAGGASIWYRYTPPAAGYLTVDTIGSGFDTVLAVYARQLSGSLKPAGSNNDITPKIVLQSRVRVKVKAGVEYDIAVDGKNAAQGAVNLTWSFIPTPVNDRFLAALSLPDQGDLSATTDGATKESMEPKHAGNAGGKSLWYVWTAPAAGMMAIDTLDSSADTLLAVYKGSKVSELKLVVANDDATDGVTHSQVGFTVVPGTVYHFAIDGKNGEAGPVHMNWLFTPGGGG